MNKKIAGIVTFQIFLIASSYLVLVFFENQSTYLGNSINTSGKNRYLGELAYEKTIRYSLANNQNPPLDIIKNIDDNIRILSHDGTTSEQVLDISQNATHVMTVPLKFSDDLNKLASNWNLYKTSLMSEMYPTKNTNILNDQDLENLRTKFIDSADQITNDLSNYSKELIENMTILEITLLGINVAAHILLLRIILKLIREDQAKKIRLQQITEENKKLQFESKFALLQKDISQSFIANMEDMMHEINEQINPRHDDTDYEKNNLIVRNIFQSLFVKIQQLAQSTIELENKTSDYEQLIQNLRNSLLVFSKNSSKLTKIKKSEDLVTIIQSHIDIVNMMIHEKRIPVKLGKNLINVLYDIIDHMTLKNDKA
ncbi:MAG: hypothetical protein KGI19_04450 [Thaumarchaeota archaeon]|nr:hypothetical protein [Nitrososphaerota archaeon]